MNLFYLEIALFVNEILYDEKEISDIIYKKIENNIYKRMAENGSI